MAIRMYVEGSRDGSTGRVLKVNLQSVANWVSYYSTKLPQSWPVITTIVNLRFFYTWNETRLASAYLNSDPALMTLSFGV